MPGEQAGGAAEGGVGSCAERLGDIHTATASCRRAWAIRLRIRGLAVGARLR